MTIISVCLGSACHLRGAGAVLQTFVTLVERYQATVEVRIQGNFCQNQCTEGVVVRINDQVLTHVTKDRVHQLFLDYVIGGENT